MGLPLEKFAPTSATVQNSAFTVEKKNLILAMDNNLIGTKTPYIEYSGASALTKFKADFGSDIAEYSALQKYFGFMSKTGGSPEKAIIVRWYKSNTAPFIKGSKIENLSALKTITNGSFKLRFNDTEEEISGLDFSSANSYSDIAKLIQVAVNGKSGDAFVNATVEYSSITGGFILTGGIAGKDNTITIIAGETGTDIIGDIGFGASAIISDGVNAETFAELCDRIYNMNTAGFAITTLESIDEDDKQNAVAWLNSPIGEQTIYTKLKLVFNYSDKATAEVFATTMNTLGYTGFVITYDPYNEYVNILDCAIGAPIDYTEANSAINFNFQPAVGYTPVTNLNTAVDYQAGQTNLALAEELDSYKISYVYGVGVGTQEQVCYGMGLMAGAFSTETVQINESWLETDLQTNVVNGFISLDNVKLQGQDAKDFVSALINPSFEQGKINGTIANGGTLLDNDKLIISQTLGKNAIDAIETNGYYYKILDLTAEDIELKRVRILCAYLCAGVLNKVRIIDNIYGA